MSGIGAAAILTMLACVCLTRANSNLYILLLFLSLTNQSAQLPLRLILQIQFFNNDKIRSLMPCFVIALYGF